MIRKIISFPLINVPLGKGAWIAGGFARAVFLGNSVHQFFKGHDYSMPGDIDLFFESQQDVVDVIKFFKDNGHVDKSYGGNAVQTTCHMNRIDAKSTDNTSIRIQVVNNPTLILPIREQLDRFDFTNVSCAFKGDVFLAPPDLLDLESRHLLEIKNGTSPFLATRIRKYMKKGFIGVTDSSRQHITDWLINALADGFKGAPGIHGTVKDVEWCKSQISELFYKNDALLRNEDLIMLIGMFKREVTNSLYGDTFVIDDVFEKIRIRNAKAA
jgi:hypothetical protein